MLPQDPSSTDPIRPDRLPPTSPFSAFERAVLGIEGVDNDPAEPDSPMAGADREHEAWPFGVASQVFLKADALTTALISAQQAHIVAKRCCMQCVAWTLALQAQAHRALADELDQQARRLRQPRPAVPIATVEW